jgi:PIN domain nuclease of toxin-antitoxin system
MSVLLDTSILVFAAARPERLSDTVRTVLSDPGRGWFSVASVWEIAIKARLGRKDFQFDGQRMRLGFLAAGWRELEIRAEHAITAAGLPLHHRDPFDRMLVGQAKFEGMELMTSDSTLARYGDWVRLI